jgi:hypothetical protein
LAEVDRQRALGFRYDGFEEMAGQTGRLKNPPLRRFRARRSGQPADIFEQQRRAG